MLPTSQILISLFLFLAFQLSNAQVTQEGNPAPSGQPSADTVSITKTDSVAPSGVTASSYYSTFHPQETVIPSVSDTSSSNTKTKVIVGVVVSIFLLFVIALTLFIIRRRMHKASVARKRRASWLSNWVPEPKPSTFHHNQNQGPRDGTPPLTNAEYPFALNLSTQKPHRASSLNQDV